MSEKEIKAGVKEEAPKKNKIKIVRNCATCKNWSGGQLLEPYGRFSYGCKFSGHLTEKQISELGTKDADGNYNCPYWNDMFPNWFDRHREFLFFVGSGFFTILGVILGYLLGKM